MGKNDRESKKQEVLLFLSDRLLHEQAKLKNLTETDNLEPTRKIITSTIKTINLVRRYV